MTDSNIQSGLYVAETKPWSVRLGRNVSWVQSVKLAMVRVLFYAPSKLVNDLSDTVVVILLGLLALPLLMISFGLFIPFHVCAGVLGFLRTPTAAEIAASIKQEKSND